MLELFEHHERKPLTPEKLIEFAKSKKKKLNIVERDVPFNERLVLSDISISKKGFEED